AELGAAAARVGALADGAAMLFGSQAAARQWIDYRLGELAASAFLLGAAEQRQQAIGAEGLAASNAVVWARRRFNVQLQALLSELAGQRPYARPAALLELVAGYANSIGDLEQGLAGEDHQPDALLRRAAAAPPAPHLQLDTPPPPSHGSATTRAIIHECLLKWLRSERREIHALDFDTPFTTLGMDSLATASIAVDLEQRLGMQVVPELLFDHQSVNQLAAFLDQHRHPAGAA
ncbi:acyl carrier protein, partial [Massilia terrae]